MEKTITVEKKNVYGNELIYPTNYVIELQTLTGQKTLSFKHIHALKEMGFKFELSQNTFAI